MEKTKNKISTLKLKKLFRVEPFEEWEGGDFPVIAYSKNDAMTMARENPLMKQYETEEGYGIYLYEIKDVNIQAYPIGFFFATEGTIEERQAFLDGIFDCIKTTCDWCQMEFETIPDCRINNEIVCQDCWNAFVEQKEETIKNLYIEKGTFEYMLDFRIRHFKTSFPGVTKTQLQLNEVDLKIVIAKQQQKPTPGRRGCWNCGSKSQIAHCSKTCDDQSSWIPTEEFKARMRLK